MSLKFAPIDPVAMVTKMWVFGQKIGYNSISMHDKSRILVQTSGFGVGQFSGIIPTRPD